MTNCKTLHSKANGLNETWSEDITSLYSLNKNCEIWTILQENTIFYENFKQFKIVSAISYSKLFNVIKIKTNFKTIQFFQNSVGAVE